MADITPDFTKKVLVDVELKSEQLKRDLPAIIQEIERLTAVQKNLQVESKTSSREFINNAQQLRNLKAEVRDTNKYIDNTAKALYAENNSIQQNRALLSLLTSEHIKLGQANGNTKKQVEASAKAINNLTEVLKAQEKQIGQTYRNVGNYTDAIKDALSQVGSAIPGFQQFANVIQTSTRIAGFLPSALANIGTSASKAGQQISNFVGFKQFSTGAKEVEKEAEGAAEGVTTLAASEQAATVAAEETTVATTGMSAAIAVAAGIIALFAAAVYGAYKYLTTLDSIADGTAQVFAGVKSSLFAAAESIRAGDWSGLSANMQTAYMEGATLAGVMQDLADSFTAAEVHSAKAEEAIGDLMLKMRNRRITPQQEQDYFNQIQAISTKNYKERKKNADDFYNLAVEDATIGTKLTNDEIKRLKKEGVDYAIILENKDKISVGSFKKIADAQKQQIAAEEFYNSVRDRSQNRLDAKQVAQEAKNAAAAAEKLRQQQKEAEAQLETENILKSSEGRVLQNIYEAYGDKVVALDNQYNTELTKLKKYLAKKLITQEVYNSVDLQLTKEHQSNITQVIEDFNKSDAAKFQQAQNGLIALHNQSIEDDTQRSIAGLKQKAKEENEQISLQNKEAQKNVTALEAEIKKLTGAAQDEAKTRRENELIGIQLNEAKRIALEKQTAQEIAKITRQASRDKVAAQDEADILQAKRKTNLFSNRGAQNAEIKATTDKYDWEISEAKRAGKETVLLEQQKIDAINAINDNYRNQKIEYAVQMEQVIQQGAFDIISQGMQANADHALSILSKQKDAELANSNLTATQKKLINDKYQKLEDAEKRKAFYANQKLQAANTLINGAVAVSKTIAEMGFLPAIPFVALTAVTTALSIAKILSAKPGFAQGGVYKSDGRGAVLPGYSKNDNTNATLRSGEAVVVSEAMRVPWARNQVSRINEMFGGRSFATTGPKPGFASGGIFTDGGNSNRYYSQPVYDSQGLANSLAYQLINNFPPIYTDVKDINTQQSILAKTVDRVNL